MHPLSLDGTGIGRGDQGGGAVGKNLTIKLTEKQLERLKAAAEYLAVNPAEAAATYVEESLREREHRHIEFRDNVWKRLAYVRGTGYKVWMLVHMLRNSFDNDLDALVDYLQCKRWQVEAAVAYAEAHPEEIDPLIAEQKSMTPEKMKELIPNLVLPELG